ncbi:MAG: xanthan lyase [Nitrospirae bacterium GWC2_57_9]|nr:MAG: xanthan lyase [Nitrospirae bacterium GWC2_57_9]
MSINYYYPLPKLTEPTEITSDVCVYGATAGGIAAAIQAVRSGKSAVLVEFSRHIGGMTTAGLGATDIGSKHVIGGLARQFYREVGAHYGMEERWHFEPHIASRVLGEWIRNHAVPLYTEHRLAGVEKDGARITALKTENGAVFKAAVYIDASYEGDLMARAGVGFRVGREGNSLYREHFNGVQYGGPHHNFRRYVDPYYKEGDRASGLLPGVSDSPPGRQGDGDGLTQSYNFRMCLSNDPKNSVPFPKPPEYDPLRYELARRYIRSGIFDIFNLTVPLPNRKFDHNNWGGINSDNIGGNYEWPDGDYETRERVFQDHVNYQQGLFWFLENDPQLPPIVRRITASWGLAADEFRDSGNWSPQLYIREARRMVSDYVVTEHNAFASREVEDPVGMASYTIDSHNCKRVVRAGRAVNEGNVEVTPIAPFAIPFRAIVPRRAECTNLLVPVCISASHAAYGSIRMEPVFMILGQCAGAAAALALGDGGVVQNVSYGSLEKKLRQEAQVIEEPRAFDELEIVGQHYLEELVPFPSSASHIVKKDAA